MHYFRKKLKTFLRFFACYFINPVLNILLCTKNGRSIMFDHPLAGDYLISKTKSGENFIVNCADKVISRSVFRDQSPFDSDNLVTAFRYLKNRKKIILDVGANIGTIGIFALSERLFERCFAFEPDPTNFKILKANIVLNGLEDKFRLHNIGLSDRPGDLFLELHADNFGDHRIYMGEVNSSDSKLSTNVISVRVATLDDTLTQDEIDQALLFIDTQGFEGHVLSGASKLIAAKAPIIAEFWPFGLRRSDGIEKFCQALVSSGYIGMRDLRYPEQLLEVSRDNIIRLSNDLGFEGRHTDLLIY